MDESSLADKATSIEKGLSAQRLTIKWLLYEKVSIPKEEKAGIPKEGTVKLYKLSAPTFDGDIFWEQFSITIDQKKELSNT